MDEYEKYEQDCKKIRNENLKILDEFESWLEESGLSDGTIQNHSSNVDFYINKYLLYEEAIKPEEGACHISMFLGSWFIRKAMWSSESSIKSNAASLKKFYMFMLEKGKIGKEDLNDLKATIKREMPEWLMEVNSF